jgi:hypothetical protein
MTRRGNCRQTWPRECACALYGYGSVAIRLGKRSAGRRRDRSDAASTGIGGVHRPREQNLHAVLPSFTCRDRSSGHSEGALTRIDEALALSRETGEHWSDAFLHRLRGEILLKCDPKSTAPAEDAFLTAIAVAQQQNARSFELRAAFSLAKLYHSTDRPADAHAVLARLRSRAFRRPRNFPRLNKRKCSSQRWRHEPIARAGDSPFLAQIWPLLDGTVRRR